MAKSSQKVKNRLRELRRKYGLGEFKSKGSSRRNTRKTGGQSMARKRSGGRRSNGGMGNIKSLLKSAVMGLGASLVLAQVAPQTGNNILVRGAAGYALGGPAGAAGAAFGPQILDMVRKGANNGGTSTTAGATFN